MRHPFIFVITDSHFMFMLCAWLVARIIRELFVRNTTGITVVEQCSSHSIVPFEYFLICTNCVQFVRQCPQFWSETFAIWICWEAFESMISTLSDWLTKHIHTYVRVLCMLVSAFLRWLFAKTCVGNENRENWGFKIPSKDQSSLLVVFRKTLTHCCILRVLIKLFAVLFRKYCIGMKIGIWGFFRVIVNDASLSMSLLVDCMIQSNSARMGIKALALYFVKFASEWKFGMFWFRAFFWMSFHPFCSP